VKPETLNAKSSLSLPTDVLKPSVPKKEVSKADALKQRQQEYLTQ
jgi:hypothetical protein